MSAAALTGFATAFSLILAIGAQNAFVLRQGLIGTHVFALCLFCALSDAVLIAAGVSGFGALTSALPWLPAALTLGGAAFLIAYGALRFRAAFRGGHALAADRACGTLWSVLGTAAAITWLNPHVYLDTLALIGAVSTRFDPGTPRTAFAFGAISASFSFFFALGYGARLLAPVMASPRAWRLLDLGIGVVMWTIAAGLVAAL
ncbi:LysE/ArgO family amino acid transporter [Rhodovulum marinum]|uniref:L-lysine exporter family protein LysE/ArgO n=1 Tax=Rhodovulum marinum TaxID=320662 RepID=A0A4R2Q0E0_9RHOB|nr:LysE/ArgO family amino acid transporter [Rhodovulum marinum]TCP40998.1 L-lysine exporter family protein LysE/ArgO [Rhodovulum marinum]